MNPVATSYKAVLNAVIHIENKKLHCLQVSGTIAYTIHRKLADHRYFALIDEILKIFIKKYSKS